ncbi:Rieske (2Fe-2S) protein [Nocardia jiangsuensis]|uniref:Rieske (2Fe-2S) protein n=1 Tax=Nocardia jiangsuensis TaxID=1691563 RepID=A0ABV8DXJ7_9NOCA
MTEFTVGRIDDIPIGEGRAFAVDGAQVAVFRLRDGSLRALGAVCPHRGGPLADGLVDDAVVVCPLHGYTYDLCTGTERTGSDLTVPVYHALADPDGTLRVRIGSPAESGAG